MTALGILEVGAQGTNPETTEGVEEATMLSISPQPTCLPCVVLDDPPVQMFGDFIERHYVEKGCRKQWVTRR